MAKPKRRNPHSVVFHSVKARRPFLKKKATNATATCTPLAEENAETIESVTQALPTLTALEARLDSRQIWNFTNGSASGWSKVHTGLSVATMDEVSTAIT